MNWTLHCGDALTVLATLPAESVSCAISSPPYWGLRDYGTGRWEGGDLECDHRSPTMRSGRRENRPTLAGSVATNAAQLRLAHSAGCGKCGARKVDQQIGLQQTPAEYVAALVDVFQEVRRVLVTGGVLWLNLGDTRMSAKGQAGGVDPKNPARRHGLRPNDVSVSGLKPKDLVGIPWTVALALRDSGWWLRADQIWNKPNGGFDSAQDRPATSHEYVFLLAKSRRYYFNAAAIREPYSESTIQQFKAAYYGKGKKDYAGAGVQNPSEIKRRMVARARSKPIEQVIAEGVHPRSVWDIPTAGSEIDHYAVMPPEFARKLVLSACPPEGIVLDPFAGASTTGVVALQEGRSFVGIELNPKYHAIGRERLAGVAPLLASEASA